MHQPKHAWLAECGLCKHGLCRLLCADTPQDGYCFCGEKMDGGADDD